MGVILALVVALLLGLNVSWQTAGYVAAQLGIAPWRSACLSGPSQWGVLLMIVLGRLLGAGGAVGGLIAGATVGAVLGFAMTVNAWMWGPAVALATLGLIVGPIVDFALTWPRLDLEAHFPRLAPRQTMAAVAETREWMEEQWRTRLPTSYLRGEHARHEPNARRSLWGT